ncbi:hypothetical protein PSTG_00738 [Puccinia striiformis f. sp. tritici PST-78]|uniref:Uncharacterized protein n=1 Tax=Puccinia striiformis f. sp. tritici PST-78 TaxID=1165861 RepID=A0A0L0W3Y9_9BASI|nr:hypothetical protein PSTG_00738 [Puccinia striiformis f. sp. tritici PST-78]
MTHSSWTTNHHKFHKTLINVYDITKFAALLLIHKKHCDDLIDEKGFMVAFWYNMQMRSNTFCHRIPVNGKSCIPDISQRKDHLIEHCYTVARNYGELKWKDNHYAPGHSHSSIDPITGQPKQNLHQIRNNNFDFNPTDNPVHVFQNQGPWMFQNQAGSFSQPFHQGPKNQNQHRDNQNGNALPGGEPRKRSKGGYKGSKFIDGYVDKRSSNTNGNNQNNAPSGSGSHSVITVSKQLSILPNWPSRVKCEMNIPLWEAALRNACLDEMYRDVILGFIKESQTTNSTVCGGIHHQIIGRPPWHAKI